VQLERSVEHHWLRFSATLAAFLRAGRGNSVCDLLLSATSNNPRHHDHRLGPRIFSEAVSDPKSITASRLVTKMALATSEASARVGRGFSVMDQQLSGWLTGRRKKNSRRRLIMFWHYPGTQPPDSSSIHRDPARLPSAVRDTQDCIEDFLSHSPAFPVSRINGVSFGATTRVFAENHVLGAAHKTTAMYSRLLFNAKTQSFRDPSG